MKKVFVFTLFLFLFSNCANPDKYGAEFLKRTVVVNDERYSYRVYVPANRQPGQKLPVMLFLHGSGDLGEDNESQLNSLAKTIGERPGNFPYIIVFPQCRKGRFWDTGMLAQAEAALDQSVKEFNGDETRLYLAGFSLGGYGAWHLAVSRPGKFAALVPISGRVRVRAYEKSSISPELVAIVETGEPYKAMAEKLAAMPIWVFHGDQDSVVPVSDSRKMVEALKKAGNDKVNYTEFAGMGHYSVEAAFGDPGLFEWLAKQKLGETK